MTRLIEPTVVRNQTRLELTCSLAQAPHKGHLELSLGELPGSHLELELDGDEQVVVTVRDFSTDDARYCVYAFTVGLDGSLQPWPKLNGRCSSPACWSPVSPKEPPISLRFVVLATRVGAAEVLVNDYPVVRLRRRGEAAG